MTRRMEYGLLHPNDRDIISALIERVTGDPPNTQTEFDYSIVRPDGTARCVHGKVRLVDEGRGRRLMGTVQDVTEQKRLEELADAARKNAEHANQAKTAFLTSMSHELRTPLNAILGYSELLMLGVRGPVSSDQQDALSRIQRSGAHLLALINDVLNFAKLKALQVRFLVADVPVSEVLESAASMVEPQASAKGLAFARPPAPRLSPSTWTRRKCSRFCSICCPTLLSSLTPAAASRSWPRRSIVGGAPRTRRWPLDPRRRRRCSSR